MMRWLSSAEPLDVDMGRVSHLPRRYTEGRGKSRVAGLGMNAEELKTNPQLSE